MNSPTESLDRLSDELKHLRIARLDRRVGLMTIPIAALALIGFAIGAIRDPRALSREDASEIASEVVQSELFRQFISQEASRSLEAMAASSGNEPRVLFGSHEAHMKGKDIPVELKFDPPFDEKPQVYVFLAGFGGDKATQVEDAYTSVLTASESAATILCSAAPHDTAWLKFNWIAVGTGRRISAIPWTSIAWNIRRHPNPELADWAVDFEVYGARKGLRCEIQLNSRAGYTNPGALLDIGEALADGLMKCSLSPGNLSAGRYLDGETMSFIFSYEGRTWTIVKSIPALDLQGPF